MGIGALPVPFLARQKVRTSLAINRAGCARWNDETNAAMTQFDREAHALYWLPALRQSRHFTLSIDDFDARVTDPHEQLANMPELFARSYATALRPAIESAKRCRLYDLRWLTQPGGHRDAQDRYPEAMREGWRMTRFINRGGGIEADLLASGILDDADFWWWIIGSGAKPVFIVPRTAVDFAALFARGFDPRLIGNLGGSTAKAAIDFARRTTADGDAVALLPRRGGYEATLTVFASPDQIGPLFREAMERATLTGGFIFQNNALASNRARNARSE
jgi:hypothetical protein